MRHLAIIPDGNRRWAKEFNLPEGAGWVQGMHTAEKVCLWAKENNISQLTVYIFSTENWNRQQYEIDMIFDIARQWFQEKKTWYIEQDICVRFRGRTDRLPQDLIEDMEEMRAASAHCTSLILEICVDYGGRDEIIRAVEAGARTEEEISSTLGSDPDCIIRFGGCHRLSNFMLWQAAYSEIYFIDTLFPALSYSDLDNCLAQYQSASKNHGR